MKRVLHLDVSTPWVISSFSQQHVMCNSESTTPEVLQLLCGMLCQSVAINFESAPLVEQRLVDV